MHIFIDESGTFALSTKPASISAVGSLTIPDHSMRGFEKLYGRIRRTLPKSDGQVKGRLLGEKEVGEVVEVLRKIGGIFEVVLIDLAMHSLEQLEAHRARQAVAITAHLTDEHHPDFKHTVWNLRSDLERMPIQLYVQAVAMENLVYHTINNAQTYYAFRSPAELKNYHWIVDAKHNGSKITPWEDWWRTATLPMLASHTFRAPFMQVEGGDYSGLARFRTTVSDWKRQFAPTSTPGEFFDLRLLMDESFRFSDESEFGLEAVDILVNAMRRSLAGNFTREGWLKLSQLMINRVPHCFQFIRLNEGPLPQSPAYVSVLKDFKRGGRSMLPPRHYLE
ncbi:MULTISPECIES: hypothetical protein [Devosia]|uniref:hypothetical protein n=1 Tax=Devosia TaxID=46913 RepID=UPI000CE9A7AA|nr:MULTISPECIES: hypothetical protein [Devosia]AVF04677.1 hypothetical protein C4375_13825 [Devosia sp. I507]